MSTTTNIVAGATLVGALVVGGIALSPDVDAAPESSFVDAGQPLVGNFYLRFDDEGSFEASAKAIGYNRPAYRPEQFCDRWATDYTDAGPVDAGCVNYGTQLVDAGSELDLGATSHAFDILGTLVVPRRDADGGIIPDGGSETIDGWHVNFSGVLPDEWKSYIVTPDYPARRMR
jgi:hypothetical protein